MKVKIILPLIGLQLFLILFLAIQIHNKQKQVLGVSVDPLPKENFLFPKNDRYKYYYEPSPNSVQNLDSLLLNELGYPPVTEIKINLNSEGFNQFSNYTIEKPKGVYRIITLGDSFTYGQNVNTQDNYPSQLEKKLNDNLKCKNITSFQVLNLGVPGYDISYSVERYKLRGEKYNPNLILWFIIDNDLTRINELQTPKTQYYDKKLAESGEADKLAKEGIFYQGWKMAMQDVIKELGGVDNIFKLENKYFLNINNYYNGPILLFNFKDKNGESYNNVLQKFKDSRKNTILYDGLADIFGDKSNYLNDNHPTKEGYKIIVDDLYNYIVRNNIIPCEKP